VLRTLTPLQPPNIATRRLPFNLHVLSTPPAFVLSQNQTLRLNDFVSYLFRPVTQSGALLPSCISIFKDHFRLLFSSPRFQLSHAKHSRNLAVMRRRNFNRFIKSAELHPMRLRFQSTSADRYEVARKERRQLSPTFPVPQELFKNLFKTAPERPPQIPHKQLQINIMQRLQFSMFFRSHSEQSRLNPATFLLFSPAPTTSNSPPVPLIPRFSEGFHLFSRNTQLCAGFQGALGQVTWPHGLFRDSSVWIRRSGPSGSAGTALASPIFQGISVTG
jgi:hypothetical protein